MPFVEYLRAVGIVPIAVTSESIGARFVSGMNFWVEEPFQRRIILRAKELVRLGYDRRDAVVAAAESYKVVLWPNDVIVDRATRLAQQLDACLHEMGKSGLLQVFHREYARRRQDHLLRGIGYMNFVTAQQRFRRALIVRLVTSSSTIGLIEEALSHGRQETISVLGLRGRRSDRSVALGHDVGPSH